MAYVEIKRFAAGAAYNIEGPFREGQTLRGKINQTRSKLDFLENDTISLNDVILDDNPVILLIQKVEF